MYLLIYPPKKTYVFINFFGREETPTMLSPHGLNFHPAPSRLGLVNLVPVIGRYQYESGIGKKKITPTLISLDLHESDARKEFVRFFSGAQLLKIYPAKNIRIGHRLGISLSFIWLGFDLWLVLLLYKLVIFFFWV